MFKKFTVPVVRLDEQTHPAADSYDRVTTNYTTGGLIPTLRFVNFPFPNNFGQQKR